MSITLQTTGDDRAVVLQDGVPILTDLTPSLALDLFNLLDEQLAGCVRCGVWMWADPAGWCGVNNGPYCPDCGHNWCKDCAA